MARRHALLAFGDCHITWILLSFYKKTELRPPRHPTKRTHQKCFDSGVLKIAPIDGGGGWNTNEVITWPIVVGGSSRSSGSFSLKVPDF